MQETIYRIRRDNLEKLVDENFGGNRAEAARCLGRKPAQVVNWINQQVNMSELNARRIEQELHLPEHWMDRAASGENTQAEEGQLTSKSLETNLRLAMDNIDQAGRKMDQNNHSAQTLVLEAKLNIRKLMALIESTREAE